MLREVKPVLNAMQDSGVFRKVRRGVCVLIDERASYHLHTKDARNMEELYPKKSSGRDCCPRWACRCMLALPEDAQGFARYPAIL
ncbi:MAG: hypothetical protein R2881_07680 [Eubacteriales bacterium]